MTRAEALAFVREEFGQAGRVHRYRAPAEEAERYQVGEVHDCDDRPWFYPRGWGSTWADAVDYCRRARHGHRVTLLPNEVRKLLGVDLLGLDLPDGMRASLRLYLEQQKRERGAK